MRGAGVSLLGADERYDFNSADGVFRARPGGAAQPCTLALDRALYGGETRYDDAADTGEDAALLKALVDRGAAVKTVAVPHVRVSRAPGAGLKNTIAARHVRETCGLSTETLTFLSSLAAAPRALPTTLRAHARRRARRGRSDVAAATRRPRFDSDGTGGRGDAAAATRNALV